MTTRADTPEPPPFAPYAGDQRRWQHEMSRAARRVRKLETVAFEALIEAGSDGTRLVKHLSQPWEPTAYGWIRWHPSPASLLPQPRQIAVTNPRAGCGTPLLRALWGTKPQVSRHITTPGIPLPLSQHTVAWAAALSMTLFAALAPHLPALYGFGTPLVSTLGLALLPRALRRLTYHQVRTIEDQHPYAQQVHQLLAAHSEMAVTGEAISRTERRTVEAVRHRVLWHALELADAAAEGDSAARDTLTAYVTCASHTPVTTVTAPQRRASSSRPRHGRSTAVAAGHRVAVAKSTYGSRPAGKPAADGRH